LIKLYGLKLVFWVMGKYGGKITPSIWKKDILSLTKYVVLLLYCMGILHKLGKKEDIKSQKC
jgi:hypothetical protein